MARVAEADIERMTTRDELARSLAWSFYGKGHTYDASMTQVIEARWKEWREQADYILARYAIFHRVEKPADDPLARMRVERSGDCVMAIESSHNGDHTYARWPDGHWTYRGPGRKLWCPVDEIDVPGRYRNAIQQEG